MHNLKICSLTFNKNPIVKSNNNEIEYFPNNNIISNEKPIYLNTSKKITKTINLNEKNRIKKLRAITNEINKELSNLNFDIPYLKNTFFISIYGKKSLNLKYLDKLKSSRDDLIKLLIKMHNLKLDICNLANMLHGTGSKIDTTILDFTNTISLFKNLGINNQNISVFNHCGSKIGNSIKAIANNINQFHELGFNNKEIFSMFKNKGIRIEETIYHFLNNKIFLKHLELDNKCLASIIRSNSPKIKKIIDRLHDLYNKFAKEINLLNTHGINKILIYKTTYKLSNNNYQEFLSLLTEFSNIFDLHKFGLYYDETLKVSLGFNNLVYMELLNQLEKLNLLINSLSISKRTLLDKILKPLKIFINEILQNIHSKIDVDSYQTLIHSISYYSKEEMIAKSPPELFFGSDSYNNQRVINKSHHSLSLESYNDENNSIFPLSENNPSNCIGNILNETFIEDNDSINNFDNSIFNFK